MKTYEIVLPGFDGSTDDTDHLIVWVNVADENDVADLRNLTEEYNAEFWGHCGAENSETVDYEFPKERQLLEKALAKAKNDFDQAAPSLK